MWSRVHALSVFDDIAQKYITHTCSHSATEPTESTERAPSRGGAAAASAPSHTLAGLPERSGRSCSRTASTEKAAPSGSEIDQKRRPPPRKSKAWRTSSFRLCCDTWKTKAAIVAACVWKPTMKAHSVSRLAWKTSITKASVPLAR